MRLIAIVANWDWVIYNFRLPLIKYLSKNGLELIVICPEGNYISKLKKAGFRHIPWNLNRRRINPVSELISLIELFQIYRTQKFYAVHHFTIKAILYGSFAARLAKIPRIINNFTGLGYLFSSTRKARIILVFILPLLRLALNFDRVATVFQNPSVREALEAKKIVRKRSTYMISGTGVDLNAYLRNNKPRKSSTPIVLMASRLLYDKGVAEFVQAAGRLKDLQINVEFQLAGEIDDGNPSSIPRPIIAGWKDLEIVNFLGHRNDIPNLLQNSDIAVLPSYHEGIPLFLLEAAASGLPIVATNIEGCRLIVEHGLNGLLIPVKDDFALASAIKKLLSDKKMRNQMGRASRKIVEEKFDIEKINQQYVDLYTKLGILDK